MPYLFLHAAMLKSMTIQNDGPCNWKSSIHYTLVTIMTAVPDGEATTFTMYSLSWAHKNKNGKQTQLMSIFYFAHYDNKTAIFRSPGKLFQLKNNW